MVVGVTFEGVSFNATHCASLSEKEFAASVDPDQWTEYSKKDRIQLIKEAYKLIKEAIEKSGS